MDSIEVLQSINSLRKSKEFLSNAFLTKPQIDELLGEGQTRVLTGNGLLLLLTNLKDYYRVYFYAQNQIALNQIKQILPKSDKPIVADVVGKEIQAKNLAKLLVHCGFEQYSTFIRMTCNLPPSMGNVDCSEVEIATSEDLEKVFELLYSEFDPLFAHIPKSQEITAAIEKSEITIVRRQGQLAGLAYFQRTSANNICLKYFVVNPLYREKGIGTALLANTFSRNPSTTKYMLWIGTYNSVVERYKRLNFVQDSIIDYIMLYRGE